MAITQCEQATDQLKMERLQQTVVALEMVLTNYHSVADGLQPSEEVGE